MTEARSRTRAFVVERISALLARPDGWGPPLAVELQLLTLVETLHALDGASDERIHSVTQRFSEYLAERVGGAPLPLAERLGLSEQASEAFTRLLAHFLLEEQSLDAELEVLPVQFQRPQQDGGSSPSAEA